MPKSKEQKKEIILNIKNKANQAKSVVFIKYDALSVVENEELRKKLKEQAGEYLVAKKTLFNLVFQEAGINGLDVKNLEGKVAAIFAYEDEVAPAKIIDEFRKTREEKITFLAGILENKFLNDKEVTELSKLPSKNELYARLVGSLNAPASGFVNVLAGNLRKFVYVLKAIEEKKS